ncbi:tetratricopeptide repeat protein [Magnetospirillum sulfuroxidans]|uniref:Tetratricopeptide repeat protein n=1 Tax=Magnetospirillum sulfuroxidans TaxID=611300 RepID=A0ABS5IFY0_9PROT|nr:tetratricopeptide repeat protein [Magnetospirillum sulfuroxidans]MBR9972668.1 tetratricopeptide repeat protein [Magnetospirillum sulfuroxidans]
MRAATELLADLGQFADHDLPVLEAALALGRIHRPASDTPAVRTAINDLIEQVRQTLPVKPLAADMAAASAAVLVDNNHFGLGGDEAESHELHELVSQYRGNGDLLALLWLSVAEGCGLGAEMLAFPLHSLIRYSDHMGGRVIVACNDGRRLDCPALRLLHKIDAGPSAELEPDFFQALSPRDVLLRWRQSLKMHHLRLGRLEPALKVVESALLFAPNRASLWREAGLMRMRLDDLPGAAAALEQFIQREDNVLARGRGQQLLAEIRSRMS